MDRFSPFAPAQVRVLVLPVGRVEKSRYLAFVQRLKSEASIVRLAELKSYAGDDEPSLSPQAFPAGAIFYHYTFSAASEQQQQLSQFELFREPLLILAVKDNVDNDGPVDQQELWGAAEYLRGRHPRVAHRQILLLQDGAASTAALPDSVICVPNVTHLGHASLRDAVCQFSVRFLRELANYIQATHATPTIQTPGQTARRLQRTFTLRERDPPSTGDVRTPTQSVDLSRSADVSEDAHSNPAPGGRSPPPTSFDQMTNGGQNRHARTDSRASASGKTGNRASSQERMERMSMQGFGGNSQDKMKARGKVRVGLAVATLHLMAGQWSEAHRLFVEQTGKARALSDHLWHAKGLEGLAVCMLLHIWARLEFQIPSLCSVGSEKLSFNGSRFSIDIPSQLRSSDSQQSSSTQLSNILPGLLKLILGLYFAGEGSLELPFVSVADATIRFCKLLTVLRSYGGQLSSEALGSLIQISSADAPEASPQSQILPTANPLKSTIAEMLSYADPSNEENLTVADHAGILAGIASVYGLLQMNRKKANAVKDLAVKLSGALVQARKRGAAEMGIHPAASLTADTGAHAIISMAEESVGLNGLMSEVASIYGIPLSDSNTFGSATSDSAPFGSDSLKLGFVAALAGFYEATPDPHGVMRVNAAILRAFGPNGALDAEPSSQSSSLLKEEQVRCITAISRTIGVAKLLRLPETEAPYWDDFLVRDVEFIPGEPDQAVAQLAKLKSGRSTEQNPGNPLLYDPHANRPRTADEVQPTSILVPNEVSICRITLQNPYEGAINVESIKLVTEGVELNANRQRFSLNPYGIQRVTLRVSPSAPGTCKVTGCLVKIEGCQERTFPIVSKPWARSAPMLIKELGQDSKSRTDESKEAQPLPGPEQKTVAVTVIEPQPMLIVDDSSVLDSTLMLLDGEIFEVKLRLRNTSDIAASIFNIVTTNDAVQLQDDVEDIDASDEPPPTEPRIVEPGESTTLTFDVVGKPSVLQVHIAFHYSSRADATHARILTIPIKMTVNAGLQVQNLDALPLDIAQNGEYSFVLSLDIGNAWPKSLFYSCFVADLGLKSAEPRRCHNHEDVLAPGQVQRVFMPIARPIAINDSTGDVVEATRKDLLDRLRIIWSVEGEERMGEIDVAGLAMNTEAQNVAAGDMIRVTLELIEAGTEGTAVTDRTVKAGSFVTLRVKLSNRSSQNYPLLVQLQSCTLNSSDSTVSEKHLAIAGTQHRFVGPIEKGGVDSIDFVLCPLLASMLMLEVMVSVALPRTKEQPRWTSTAKLLMIVT